jgi:PEP-CTERM motif
MPLSRYIVALTLFLFFSGESEANFLPGLTVDRANQFFNQSLNYSAFTPIGESFTPTLDGIQWAAFGMQDFTTTGIGAFDVDLFQGVGTTGTLLATSATTNLPPGFGIPGPGAYAYFYFGSEVALTPGTPYTLILNQLSGDTFLVLAASVSQTGNTAILFGQPQANLNLTFGEGIFTVPEPSTLTLLGIAAVCMTAVARRGALRQARRSVASLPCRWHPSSGIVCRSRSCTR